MRDYLLKSRFQGRLTAKGIISLLLVMQSGITVSEFGISLSIVFQIHRWIFNDTTVKAR